MLIAVGTFILLWMLFSGGAGAGVSDTIKYKGTVSYEVRDALGNLKASNVIQNEITALGLNAIVDQVTTSGGTAYAQIAALDNISTIDVEIPSADITLNLDGAAVDPGLDDTVDFNPATGAVVAASSGSGTVFVKYQARAATTVIAQLALVNVVQNNSAGSVAAIPAANVFAKLPVTITLETGDTLDVTWTITAIDS